MKEQRDAIRACLRVLSEACFYAEHPPSSAAQPEIAEEYRRLARDFEVAEYELQMFSRSISTEDRPILASAGEAGQAIQCLARRVEAGEPVGEKDVASLLDSRKNFVRAGRPFTAL